MTATTAKTSTALSSAEIERARDYLERTETALKAATVGLSEAQWNFVPAPGRWSIAGILEHCVIIHELILGRIREQLAAAPLGPNPDAAAVDDLIWTRSTDRSLKFNAPEFVYPTGRLSPTAGLEQLRDGNARLIEWLETAQDLRDHCVPSPPAKGMSNGAFELMDGYQFILLAAGHVDRHICQIQEVKAAANFPAA